MKSDTIGSIAAALSAAQASMANATKSGTNPHLKSSYSDLADVWDACRSVLGANQLAVFQPTTIIDGQAAVETMLVHSSGEWITGTMPIIADPAKGPQAFGSALTYARRQSLSAMVGISPADDDAEAAMTRGTAQARTSAPDATQALANSQRQAMTTPVAVLSDTSGEGPYRVHSVRPGEGNRPTTIKLVDAAGAIRDTVTWTDQLIQQAEGFFDNQTWVAVDVREKEGREKRDNPGERWPSSFELDGIAGVEGPGAAPQAAEVQTEVLGSPMMAPGETVAPVAAPVAAVDPDDLPF